MHLAKLDKYRIRTSVLIEPVGEHFRTTCGHRSHVTHNRSSLQLDYICDASLSKSADDLRKQVVCRSIHWFMHISKNVFAKRIYKSYAAYLNSNI